jgi:O-antigen/teichoic acid export membrane protein
MMSSGSDDQPSRDPDRGETWIERLDRNWSELLQELRVMQTGVQLLTGFLLTLPFQQRFSDLTSHQRVIYLGDVACSVCSTVLLIAPVALHRLLFRQHARAEQVSVAHRLALAGSTLLGVAICGVVVLIFDVVSGASAAVGGGIVAGLLVLSLWLVLPLTRRAAHRRAADQELRD